MSDQVPLFGAVSRYEHEGRTLRLFSGDALLAISLLGPHLVRVRYAPQGALRPRPSWAVTPDDASFPELADPVQISEDDFHLRVQSGGQLLLQIERATGQLSFHDQYGAFWADEGVPFHVGTDLVVRKRIAADDTLYGLGERSGRLDRRGRTYTNWTSDPPWGHGPGTDPLYIAIPIGLVARPERWYGFFLNNSHRSSFDAAATHPERYELRISGGELDYYLFWGRTPAATSEAIAALLGTTPMPPRWALGYHQSRWSYMNEGEIRRLVAEFRARQLPLDAIHFDIDYMDGYRVFTWDEERFSHPAQLIAELAQLGIRVVTIVDPGVKRDPAYHTYADGLEQGMFVLKADGSLFHGNVWPDDSAFPDFLRPDVRAWWGRQQQVLVDAGVSGIWNDMNEPTVFERPFSEGFSPPGTIDLDAPQGPPDARTTHAEAHNLYGMNMARASYDGFRTAKPDQRPFVLTRSAYAGVQRYSACWMGDNNSWWEHLELTIPQLTNMALSGVPFVGVDIGGFFGNATPELFARWVQLGAFLPFARGHSVAGSLPHEPWVFGPQVEAIAREYLNLRYSLLPYLYSLFREAQLAGTPVLRPLVYHHSEDPATYPIFDQALCGEWIMVAPVCRAEADYRHIYLPEGNWFDWWSQDVITGPTNLLEYAPLERMPIFVRAGAIIPRTAPAANTAAQGSHDLTLELFPGNGVLTLYEDDGISHTYEQGNYAETPLALAVHGTDLLLQIGPRSGNYVLGTRQLRLRVRSARPDARVDRPGGSYLNDEGVFEVTITDDGSLQTITFGM